MNAGIAPQCPTAGGVDDEAIRDYAYHLYVQSGHRNDQCCDNWREAEACIRLGIPKSENQVRLFTSAPEGKN